VHNRESPLRVGNDLKDDHLSCSSIDGNIEIVSYKSFCKRKNRNNYALVGLL
jgi:hypothetical protein